jgi:hypothetical protein
MSMTDRLTYEELQSLCAQQYAELARLRRADTLPKRPSFRRADAPLGTATSTLAPNEPRA